MKRFVLILACTLAIACADLTPLSAQTPLGKVFGFGFTVGEPTAFSIRLRTGRSSAFDASVGKSAFGFPRIDARYVWEFTNLFKTPALGAYVGVGAMTGLGDKGEYMVFNTKASHTHWYTTSDAVVAGRFTAGIDWFPRYTPLELFAEVDPIIGFIPEAGLGLEWTIGLRIYP